MATDDRCVTIHPYFEVKQGELANIRSYLEKFVELTKSEPDCLYYGITTCGNKLHCREGYASAAGALAHLDNVGPLLQEMLGSGKVELTELQIHGPEQELAKLREPLKDLNPTYWVLEYGFRNRAV
jgi:quinol monooxygenase YgiN